MTLKEKLKEAKEFLFDKNLPTPQVGIVLGSGLGTFGERVENPVAIPYGEIPHFAKTAVKGHKGRLIFGKVQGVDVVCQQGRFHFYEGHPMESVVFPARLMGNLGIKKALVTNAAGAVNKSLIPGDLMVLSDHINYLGTNPLIGPNEETFGERFPDMSGCYSPELRKIAKNVATKLGFSLREGVYLAGTGPSYETPAEIRMFRRWGADAIGMSTVPEVIVLRHMGVEVLGLSCITNMGAGILPQPLNHEEVIEVGKQVEEKFGKLLHGILGEFHP